LGRAHEQFANEEGIEAGVAQAGNVIGGFETALGYLDHASGNFFNQLIGGFEIDFKGMQVAIVDPD